MSGVLSKSVWSDEVPPKKGVSVSVNDVAYSPDGTRCIVAAGSRVLLYDATDGNLIKSLRGHENTVYSVDFSADGSHFASGGADNSVVIWKISGQGKLKYPHSAAIQRVKYNPVSFQLASCSDVSFFRFELNMRAPIHLLYAILYGANPSVQSPTSHLLSPPHYNLGGFWSVDA